MAHFYINIGCVTDPIFGTKFCLDFNEWTIVGIIIIILGVITYLWLKENVFG